MTAEPEALRLAAATWLIAGALVAATLRHRTAAAPVAWLLVSLAVWIASSGIVSSLALSAALAFFAAVLARLDQPSMLVRRACTMVVYGLDAITGILAFLPTLSQWRVATLLGLDVMVAACAVSAVASEQRGRLAVWMAFPTIALCAVMAWSDWAALSGDYRPPEGTLAIAQTVIACALTVCLIVGLAVAKLPTEDQRRR